MSICNLSRRQPVIINSKLTLRHFPCDLSVSSQVDEAIEAVGQYLEKEVPEGRVLLVNNSGFGVYGSFAETSGSQQLEMVDVNVRAVLQLTAGFLPTLRKRGGAVVTIASVAAFQPTPYLATYGATKAFVLSWSLALNEELRGSGVTALAVCPGPTSTQFFERAGLEPGSVPDSLGQTSEEVVEATLRALAGGKSMVVSGWKNKVMASLGSLFPKPLVSRVSAWALRRYRLKQVKR